MYLHLYEQETPLLTGESVLLAETDPDMPDHVLIDVQDGPAGLTEEQVAKLVMWLVTWQRLRNEGKPVTPEHPVFAAGR